MMTCFAIATLGFRGEALPSIGSIARMEIVSRQAGAATGQRLRVDGGRKDELRAAPAAPGTTIEIKDIFLTPRPGASFSKRRRPS